MKLLSNRSFPKRVLLFSLLIVIIALGAGLNKKAKLQKEVSPDEPYEAFMLQRTYPNKTFDINAYRTALNSAVQSYAEQKTNNASSWVLEGPGNIGGRFNCTAVCPGNSNIIYAGSANGGLWKTTDNGQTWVPLTDALAYQAIGAIAINPNNVNEIWIGTGDLNISGTLYTGNGVYKSTDAGQTWTYLGLSSSYVVSSIVFNKSNSNQVLVSTMGNPFNKDMNRGMYRTSDGGATFTNTLLVNDSTGIIDMVQHPSNPAIVYVTSFTRLRTDRTSAVMGTQVLVYKSSDFGQTWTALSGGLPNGQLHERLGISISASSPSLLYALYSTSDGTNPQLYKSTNDGTSWQQVSINTFATSSYGTYGWYFGKIYIDPVNPSTLYMPGIDLQYSTDSGASWAALTPTWSSYIVHGDGHHLLFNSSTDMIYCTDGGLYRTLDGGQNWTDIENIPVNQFYSVTEDPNNLGQYAGGVQDNGTMFGNASVINNFTRLYGGDGFTVEYTTNPQLVYAESQNGDIVYDAAFNSGNWTNISKDNAQNYNWHTPYFASKHNQKNLFFGGQRVMLIHGAPNSPYSYFSPVLNNPTSPARVANISTINQSLLDSTILYAGTSDGKVWNTLDYGVSWTDITPFQGSSYYVTRVMPSPNNTLNAYVTRSGYRANDNTPLIFKTTNKGAIWTNISGNLPALAVNAIQILPGNENMIFIANDAGVYYTKDGGVSWNRLGTNMPFVAVLDIQFNSNHTRLIAGTFGRSMYTMDLNSIMTGIPENYSGQKIDIRVYPNPASDYVIIACDKGIETVSLFSVNGALLLKTSSTKISLSSLPKGVYIVEVSAFNQKIRKQIIKQ